MYNNSNSNFAIVVFVVLVLVGGGYLLYHCIEISTENRQLTEVMGTYQASAEAITAENTTLRTTNEALTSENNVLMTENADLAAENHRLVGELDAAHAEVTSLQTNEGILNELETLQLENSVLRQENQRLNSMLGDTDATKASGHEVLQSTLLPDNPDFLMNVALVVVIGLSLFLAYILYLLYRQLRPKKAPAISAAHTERSTTYKNRHDHLLDSHFYDQ